MTQLKILALMWIVFFAGCLIARYPLRTALWASSITVAVASVIVLAGRGATWWEERKLAIEATKPAHDDGGEATGDE